MDFFDDKFQNLSLDQNPLEKISYSDIDYLANQMNFISINTDFKGMILDSKKNIKIYFEEIAAKSIGYDSYNSFIYLHSKLMNIWDKHLGTKRLVLSYGYQSISNIKDFLNYWDQIFSYFNIHLESIYNIYHDFETDLYDHMYYVLWAT